MESEMGKGTTFTITLPVDGDGKGMMPMRAPGYWSSTTSCISAPAASDLLKTGYTAQYALMGMKL